MFKSPLNTYSLTLPDDNHGVAGHTDNSHHDFNPRIHNGQIVWEAQSAALGFPYEIDLYDGTKIVPLTEGKYYYRYPRIHNDQVVWQGFAYNHYGIYLATPLGYSLEFLDGKDFTAGLEISSDAEVLASDGEVVEGAVTDGVTRLLLRMNVQNLGTVTFTLNGTGDTKEGGILRAVDGSAEGTSIDVNTVTTSEGEKVFAIYQAPENFVRDQYAAEDKEISERTIPLKINYTYQIGEQEIVDNIEKTIRLVRPPLILVHGLWSYPSIWKGFQKEMRKILPDLYILRVGYEETNDQHFKVNKDVLRTHIEMLQDVLLKSEKIAMVQADVVGHSMGGILTRINYQGDEWYGSNSYKKKENYNRGNINRYISLNSVHFGSFLADWVIKIEESLPLGLSEMFVEEMRSKERPIDGGAVEDLTTTSEEIKRMNSIVTGVNPKSHAIASDYTINVDLCLVPGSLGIVCMAARFFGVETIMDIVPGESDTVVSTKSQSGGMQTPSLSVYDHFHGEAPDSNQVLNETYNLINADLASDLFEDGFPSGLYP